MCQPLRFSNAQHPIVIVVDALNESGTESERRSILKILGDPTRSSNLPGHIRILLTSRPEQDIRDSFSEQSHIVIRQMYEIDANSTYDDILAFIHDQLGNIPALDEIWPKGEWKRNLAGKSERIFQWAAIACNFIKPTGWLRDQSCDIMPSSNQDPR